MIVPPRASTCARGASGSRSVVAEPSPIAAVGADTSVPGCAAAVATNGRETTMIATSAFAPTRIARTERRDHRGREAKEGPDPLGRSFESFRRLRGDTECDAPRRRRRL